jgi:hypothetical protein
LPWFSFHNEEEAFFFLIGGHDPLPIEDTQLFH